MQVSIDLNDPGVAELVTVVRRSDRGVLAAVLAALLVEPAGDALPVVPERQAAVAAPSELLADPERMLTEVEAASLLGVSNRTLQAYRYTNDGPQWLRVGRGRGRIVYPAKGIASYIAAVGHGSLQRAAG